MDMVLDLRTRKKHQKIKNEKAIQIFTKIGPVAFLPISNSETSIVFSIINKKVILNENEIKTIRGLKWTKHSVGRFLKYVSQNVNLVSIPDDTITDFRGKKKGK